jgi:hypothetical protein
VDFFAQRLQLAGKLVDLVLLAADLRARVTQCGVLAL